MEGVLSKSSLKTSWVCADRLMRKLLITVIRQNFMGSFLLLLLLTIHLKIAVFFF